MAHGPSRIDHDGRAVGLVHVDDGWRGGRRDECPKRGEDRRIKLQQSIRIVVLQDGDVPLAQLTVDTSSACGGRADQSITGYHRHEDYGEALCKGGDAVVEGAYGEGGLGDPGREHHLARVGHKVICDWYSLHSWYYHPGQGDRIEGPSLPGHCQREVPRLRYVGGKV